MRNKDSSFCCPGFGTVLGSGGTFADWASVKDKIVATTGTGCYKGAHVAWDHNEFDANGLDANALAGIFWWTDADGSGADEGEPPQSGPQKGASMSPSNSES